jgi:predicted amidohydrolase
MEAFAAQADADGVELLLFPECFLQGYLVEERHLHQHALRLDELPYGRLSRIEQTLVFGVIERRDGRFYNTVVVVERGKLLGAYRKTHLVPGEALFDKGNDYPVFERGGVRFGVNICYDMQFAEAAAAVAVQGARLLLGSAQNMMRREHAEHWKELHNSIRAERVRETGMWLVSSDVTGERGTERIAYGPTCVFNPQSEIVAQVPLTTGRERGEGQGRSERAGRARTGPLSHSRSAGRVSGGGRCRAGRGSRRPGTSRSAR